MSVFLHHILNRDSWAYCGTAWPLGLVFEPPTSCRRHIWPWAVWLCVPFVPGLISSRRLMVVVGPRPPRVGETRSRQSKLGTEP